MRLLIAIALAACGGSEPHAFTDRTTALATDTATLRTSRTSVPSDGRTLATLTATVKDASGAAIAGRAVTFASSDPGDVFSSVTVTTGTYGTAATTVHSAWGGSAIIGTHTITAHADAGTDPSVSIAFTAPTLPPPSTAIRASRGTAPADDATPVTLTVTLKDSWGRPIANQPVTITSSEPTDEWEWEDPDCTEHYEWGTFTGSTSSLGIWAIPITATVAGAHTFTADGGLGTTASVAVTFQ